MYKKILSFILIALLLLTMAACTKDDGVGNPDNPNGVQESDLDDHSLDQEDGQTEGEEQGPVTENVFGTDTSDGEGEEGSASQGSTSQNNGGTADSNVSGGNGDNDTSDSTPSSGNNTQVSDGSNTTDGGSGTVTTVPEKIEDCTYEEYHAMTPEAQQQFFAKFESIEKFFEWYNAAKAQYEEDNQAIEIGDGQIDLNEVLGGEE